MRKSEDTWTANGKNATEGRGEEPGGRSEDFFSFFFPFLFGRLFKEHF